MAVNELYEATVWTDVGGVFCGNVLHYLQLDDAGVFPGPENELALAINNALVPVWRAAISQDATLTCVDTQRIYPDRGDKITNLIGSGAGLRLFESLPPNAAGLVTLYGADTKPMRTGRFYLAGVSEEDHDKNVLTDAYFAVEFFNLAQEIASQIVNNAIKWDPYTYNPTLDVPGNPISPFTKIDLWIPHSPLNKQRRRTFRSSAPCATVQP